MSRGALPLLLAALAVPVFGEAAPISKDKLLELVVLPPKTAYMGQKLVVSWHGKQSRAHEVRVYYKPPNRWRHEVLDSAGGVIKTTVQNGAREWVQRAGSDVVLARDIRRIRHGELNDSGLKALLAENFEVRDAGVQEYSGVGAQGVVLQPKADAGSRRVLWVDPRSGIVMHRRQSSHAGQRIQEARLTHVEIKQDLDDALFKPPAGGNIEIINAPERAAIVSSGALARYGFTGTAWHATLPFGYRLDTVRAIPLAGETVAHFRYSNGLSLLSVFVSPYAIDASDFSAAGEEEDDADAEFAAVSWAGSFLSWKNGKYYYLIVGDLSRRRLKDVREALERSNG
ncbi:MAG: sigma-E factor regulatory protein RseB domain-containing protein [Elusimicrobiota bacterium]